MRQTVLGVMAVLALTACGEASPPPPTPPPPPPEYASNWYSADNGMPGMVVNIHETALGLGGFLREADGTSSPIRDITLSNDQMLFSVPSLNAAYEAHRGENGSWAGKWTTKGKATDLVLHTQPAPEAVDFVKFDDGRWAQFRCSGTGTPAILLDYGAGGSMNSWKDVFEPLSKISRTCVFERAARGLSDPGPMPRDVNAAVADMDSFIRAAKLGTPVVLVGHSMASYHVRQFANLHLDETAGIVLVDPSGDGQNARFMELIPNLRDLMPDNVEEPMVAECADALRRNLHTAPLSQTRDDPDPMVGKCGGADPDRAEATLSEIASMEVTSTNEIRAAQRPYGDMPLIVLTRSDYEKDMPAAFTAQNTAALKKVWTQMHEEMAARSTIGQHRVVPGAGHSIQRDQPQAVIDAVAEIVREARTRNP